MLDSNPYFACLGNCCCAFVWPLSCLSFTLLFPLCVCVWGGCCGCVLWVCVCVCVGVVSVGVCGCCVGVGVVCIADICLWANHLCIRVCCVHVKYIQCVRMCSHMGAFTHNTHYWFL